MPTVVEMVDWHWRREVERCPRLGDVPFCPRSYEWQLNVSSAGAEPVADKRGVWSDGCDTWWNVRYPKDADGKKREPWFRDYAINWPLHEKAERLGSSGWNWRDKHSHWCGYDFDSIVGHGEGLTDEQLDEIRQRTIALPYTIVRRSTSGRGLHVIARVNEPNVRTHDEHAALAKAVLRRLSKDTGFDFAPALDVFGRILWLWTAKLNDRSYERCT